MSDIIPNKTNSAVRSGYRLFTNSAPNVIYRLNLRTGVWGRD